MSKTKKEAEEIEIDMTPMIDMTFLLIIFFKYLISIVDWSWMMCIVHIEMAMNKIGLRISFLDNFAEFVDLCFSCEGRQSS